MGQASLKILRVGPSTSIQDGGRLGYTRFGVTRSGPMDRLSFTLANCALGKSKYSAALEISLAGLSIQCETGILNAALVGGSFKCRLDGITIPSCSVFTLEAGSTLDIQPGEWGSWCYLALSGEINSDTWLSSQSVHLSSGLCGVPFKSGDNITLHNISNTVEAPRHILDADMLKPANLARVVMGPQDHFFDEEARESLCAKPFKFTAEYNRMGARLAGPKLSIHTDLDLPSEPIARGSLQVPGHGDPICLLADHQTTGGYPKIATVISSDQDKVAQHRVGDTLRFKAIDVASAIAVAREHAHYKNQLIKVIKTHDEDLTERLLSHNLISGVSRL